MQPNIEHPSDDFDRIEPLAGQDPNIAELSYLEHCINQGWVLTNPDGSTSFGPGAMILKSGGLHFS